MTRRDPLPRPILLLALLLGVLVQLGAPTQAQARETITRFHAAIVLDPSGALEVTERIEARVANQKIKHGLYRDFPLTFTKADGSTGRVDFEVTGVTIDGAPGPWHTERISGGIRIYMGDGDVVLEPGSHAFSLSYVADREIRYFDTHDELYWNVTGNGWAFPIELVTAIISLPPGTPPDEMAVYTGSQGERGSDATIRREGDRVVVRSTKTLRPGEGLTFAIALPKGVVAPPSDLQAALWGLGDNINLILGVVGFGLVLGFYLWAWGRVGKDPPPDVVVPRWHPPKGLSPALVNYVDGKGFRGQGWTAIAASFIDLAVKGFVTLDTREPKTLRVTRTDKADDPRLPKGQYLLLRRLAGAGSSFVVNKAHGAAVKEMNSSFTTAIEGEHRGRYYVWNRGYVVAGVALSLAVILAMVVLGTLDPAMAPLILPVAMGAAGAAVLAYKVRALMGGTRSLFKRILGVIFTGVGLFVVLGVMGGTLAGAFFEGDIRSTEVILLAFVGGIVLCNALFALLMGAPTALGVKLGAEVEGLRTYLELAEKDRMNMAGVPEVTPSHFETLLPYAVALGVEKPWSELFEARLAAAARTEDYQPVWYVGDHYHGRGWASDMGDLSSSMASTMASSLPDPPSSSSSGIGGGGFSGGGGGGGGGGGW